MIGKYKVQIRHILNDIHYDIQDYMSSKEPNEEMERELDALMEMEIRLKEVLQTC